MNKDRLKEIMFDQKDVFNRKKHLITRDIKLEKYLDTNQVVIKRGLLLVYEADKSLIHEKEGVEVIPVWKWLLA